MRFLSLWKDHIFTGLIKPKYSHNLGIWKKQDLKEAMLSIVEVAGSKVEANREDDEAEEEAVAPPASASETKEE